MVKVTKYVYSVNKKHTKHIKHTRHTENDISILLKRLNENIKDEIENGFGADKTSLNEFIDLIFDQKDGKSLKLHLKKLLDTTLVDYASQN